MGRDEGCAVVLLDDVEDDAGVGRVVVVAVSAPAAGAQVELDIPAELGAVELDDGVAGVRAVARGGDAGEADAEAAPVLDAGRDAQAGEPALGEGGLATGGGEHAHGLPSSSGSGAGGEAS